MTQAPATTATGFLARGLQVLLPCTVFAAVLWPVDPSLHFLLAMLLFFVVILAWETWRPLQAPQLNVWRRWPAHGLMWALNVVIGSRVGQFLVLLAVSRNIPYGSGWIADTFDNPVAGTLFCVLVLDAWHYVLHRLMHRWTWLWRMHRVHHSDRDFDLTTGLRFHPLEGVVTTVWMLIPVLALGMPFYALVANAIITLTVDYFTHANAQLPPRVERQVRKLLVTPCMHRIHHSVLAPEDRYNYSTAFSFWDRLFGTYKARSAQKRRAPLTGVEELSAAQSSSSVDLLRMPFTRLPTPGAVKNDRAVIKTPRRSRK